MGWLTTLLMLLLAAASQANQTQTVPLRLSQSAGADWEGQFCFELSQPILGYLVAVNFNAGIKDIKNWLGDWIKKEPCSQQWTLVNGDIHGLHQAGEFCVRLAGTLCSVTDPSATATLIDLTGDTQVPPTPPTVSGAQTMKYNYAEVLQKSILFYEAQRSGKLPANNRIPWRGDSALQDRGDKGEDLTGGWYDAGDNVKFNFPMAFSTTLLCWSLLEFPQAYEKAGQLDYMYDSIRWPLEYFVKCHTGPNELYVQQWVGNWQGNPPDCSTTWTMLNQDSHGVHAAGEFCVRMMGRLCGTPTHLSGQGTLIDLTDDGQRVPAVPAVTGAQTMKYNYAEVLQKSILFYEAQRSGKLPANNRIPWRGDSALQDRGDKGEDLTGGWYDAGDNVKFNFPMAFSTTLLCWSLLEFKDAYEKAGQLDYMYDSIRWPLEYFVKCHTGPNELYVQVGTGSSDHGSWTSPERMDQNRKAYKVTAASPGSDVAGETAAAMACGSIVFQNKDKTFADSLLQHSRQLFDFAQAHEGFYSSSVADAAAFYKSNNYSDEVTWSAAWLFKATHENKYLEIAKKGYLPGPAWGFSWDEKLAGNMVLMYNLTGGDAQYRQDIEDSMTAWSKAGGMQYTPKCLAFRLQWGALRYSANMAFFALLAADLGLHPDQYRQWAMCQIHYALGDTGRSFVVGFGVNPPTRPHHRASSCPMLPAPCGWEAQQNPGPNPHVLYGALVGGPGSSDDYVDDRKDYVHNEVACDYNAGFQGAAAALLHLAIKHQLPDGSKCGTC